MNTYHSKVKWFDSKKGFGFIEDPDGFEKDIFVHYKDIVGDDDYRTLEKDQIVTFDVQVTPKGLAAINVRPL